MEEAKKMALRKTSRVKSLSLCDDFPLGSPRYPRPTLLKKYENSGKILKYIDENIIGKGVAFLGPFGRRRVVYADYAYTGRSLQFLEDYINKEVLPAFGNINCTSSVTGLQSNLYFNEAKEIIKSAVNATIDDELIFCDGSFSSSGEQFCYLFKSFYNNDNQENFCKIILFVSTCEPLHNLMPWIKAGVQIEKIIKTRDGFLDLVDLEKKLLYYVDSGRKLIGFFPGAARLTGILTDDVATTILLHQFGALAIWDYSSSAPSVLLNINPSLAGAIKDAVFINGNRFIGGVQAPGILIVKKRLIVNKITTTTSLNCSNVIGAVRAGLVVQLKESLGLNAITLRQEKICKQILSHIRTIPEIILLGQSTNTITNRLPTLCFLVRHPRGAFLHHKFVVCVLNDIFGIQATAGTYLGEELGITKNLMIDYEKILDDNNIIKSESLRTGYTRIFLPYFMPEQEVGFIMEALKMVATEAWKLLPQYQVDELTGDWRHQSNSLAKERKLLGAIRYTDGRMLFSDRKISGLGGMPQSYTDCLQTARNVFNRSRKMAQKTTVNDNLPLQLGHKKLEELRWFMLPGEAHKLLLGHSQNVKQTVPFDPNRKKEPIGLLTHRHNSLSALDVKKFKIRTSSLALDTNTKQSMSESSATTITTTPIQRPIVQFSLGGEVTPLNFSTPRIANLISNDALMSRDRCNSWEPTSLEQFDKTNGTIISRVPFKERSCSCSSQTDNNGSDTTDDPDSSSICNDNIQAYVKEVTKELATEIKSEIREVISQVEDVLENTDSLDMSGINLNSMNNSIMEDSVSAADVAEYLKEYSKEMTSDIKLEIREMVNAVDGMISPGPDMQSNYYKNSDWRVPMFNGKGAKHRFSDTTPETQSAIIEINKNRSESFPRPNSSPNWYKQTATCPENSTPQCPYTGAISKLIDTDGTASQDSGINLCFQDGGDDRKDSTKLNILRSHNMLVSAKRFDDNNLTDISIMVNSEKSLGTIQKLPVLHSPLNLMLQPIATTLSPTTKSNVLSPLRSPTTDFSIQNDTVRWHNLPKDVWKQVTEALDEYEMLKDGDKILICLSGSSSSLCLLHAIRQFSLARMIHIEMGAIAIGDFGVDPRVLMLYMRDLGIEFILEQQGTKSIRTKLCATARSKGYNVLAMGNTLDKLADEFLVSVLYKGRLRALQAHCYREGDIKIIRPFIYIRERILEEFSKQNSLPTRPSKTLTRSPDAQNSILKVQELINPNVYDNIKNALKPFLSHRIDIDLQYDVFKSR